MGCSIDLNLDAGEIPELLADGREARLYDLVTTVNIACGGHAGDDATMRKAVRLAKERDLAIGAHPSYPDRENFGRKPVTIGFEELKRSILKQISRLQRICNDAGVRLTHLKPHGALYNVAATDHETASVLIEVAKECGQELAIVGLASSEFAHWCTQSGVRFIGEAFVDRRYEKDGRLRSRSFSDALITDPQEACAQALSLVRDGRVQSVSGDWVDVEAETLCIHGDSPEAFRHLQGLRKALRAAGVDVRRFDQKGRPQ